VSPQAVRSVASGPWSLEWLCNQNHSEAGVVSSSRKAFRKGPRTKGGVSHLDAIDQKRKKVNGVLSHTIHSLKKSGKIAYQGSDYGCAYPEEKGAQVSRITKNEESGDDGF